MKTKFTSVALVALGLISTNLPAQNIFNGEPVQVVGSFNGYATAPYNTDYRTTAFRRVSVATGTPTDGRGQWATTINVQASGGDAVPVNMAGGSGAGFLFITGPTPNRYQNKWAFSGVGQGALNGINTCVFGNPGEDMGLNMNTAGRYTFIMNDCGYTATNARYYVAYTQNAPVTVSRTSQVVNANGTITVNITSSLAPSTGENIFVRYVYGAAADFSGSTATTAIQATGSGITWTATIPAPPASNTVKYYVYTSTRSLALLNTGGAVGEVDESLSAIRYDDNAGLNYTQAVVLPVSLSSFTGTLSNGAIALNWKTATELNAASFEVEKLNGTWGKIGSVLATNNANGGSYSFVDASLSNSNVYRLKSIDKDGTSSYSNAISVNSNAINANIKVYPTIVSDGTVNIRLQQPTISKISIGVLSIDGKLLQNKTIDVAAGTVTVQHQMGNLQKGIYIVKVATSKETKSFEIVVE